MKVHQKFEEKKIDSQHARGFSIEFNYNFNFHVFFSNIVEFVEWNDVWSPFLAGLAFSIGLCVFFSSPNLFLVFVLSLFVVGILENLPGKFEE